MENPKKVVAESAVTAPAAGPLAEGSHFEPDQETGNAGKNRTLAILLGGPWKSLAILRVERRDGGWLVVYRE